MRSSLSRVLASSLAVGVIVLDILLATSTPSEDVPLIAAASASLVVGLGLMLRSRRATAASWSARRINFGWISRRH